MSLVKNDSDSLVQSKEQPDSSSNDKGSYGRSLVSRGVVLKKGPWTSAEDAILIDYVKKHGEGNWNAVQKHSGLFRCGKSCRLRWANHLRPNLKKGVFTKEEEQKIIQMHAKIGNKWARMASFLPGRTDNEIKNYWNTRVKRRKRAGLPLYPPNLCKHASNEDQFGSDGKQNCGVSQGTTHEVQGFGFVPHVANLESLGSLPHPPLQSPVTLDSGMLSKGLGSLNSPLFSSPGLDCLSNWDSVNSWRYLGALKVPVFEQLSTELSYLTYRNVQSSHLNNYSVSSHPLGAAKMELPSLQYPESDHTNLPTYPFPLCQEVECFIQSPGDVSVQSNCASAISSGLLEALVHESQAISSGKKPSSEKCSSTSAISPSDMMESSVVNFSSSEWEETSDHNNPFSQSAVSLLNECTLINGSSIDEPPCCQASSVVEPTLQTTKPVTPGGLLDEGTVHPPDFLEPDALAGLDWFVGSSQVLKESSGMDDAIVALLADSPSPASSDPLAYCPWQNMPSVHQMPDTPKFA